MYYEYLRSPEWKRKRRLRIEMDNFTCQTCGIKFPDSRIQVHHKTYDRIFNEDMNDLETICKPCHQSEHVDKIIEVEKKKEWLKKPVKARKGKHKDWLKGLHNRQEKIKETIQSGKLVTTKTGQTIRIVE